MHGRLGRGTRYLWVEYSKSENNDRDDCDADYDIAGADDVDIDDDVDDCDDVDHTDDVDADDDDGDDGDT